VGLVARKTNAQQFTTYRQYKHEDTPIIDLKTRWRFVRLYILMVVSNDHFLLGCDATYFDRHQHYRELVTM